MMRDGTGRLLFGLVLMACVGGGTPAAAQEELFAGGEAAIVLGLEAPSQKDLADFALLAIGRTIQLAEGEVLRLGYQESCVVEEITGGAVTIGVVQSKVVGGTVVRGTADCGLFRYRHSTAQLQGVAISVFEDAGAVAAPVPDHAHSVAVVIGNRTYQGRIPQVAYAHRDADAIRRYLVGVLGYREENIIDLRDATKGQLESAFGNRASHEGRLFSYLRPGRGHVTVFYSGHGVPGQSDRRGYLLPVDASPDTVEINGYPLDLLYENLARLQARSVTVYLDACFSGDSNAGMLIRAASPVFVAPRLPQTTNALTVLTAASAEQVASWDEKKRHGLFTWYLLQALKGQADAAPFGDGNGVVILSEAKAYLDEEMSHAARRRFPGRTQTAGAQGADDAVLGVVPSPDQVAALAPGFTITPVARTLFVTATRVNVRTGPGTDFDKLASLSQGAEVAVTGEVDGSDWVRVALAGVGAGFIFSPLLSDRPPAAATPAVGVAPPAPRPGDSFRDCDRCPEVTIVPAGAFQMGAPSFEPDRVEAEGPVHGVTIAEAVAVGTHPVTRTEYAAFVAAAGEGGGPACETLEEGAWAVRPGRSWRDPGFRQGGTDPVVCVNWDDARAYVAWLSRETGRDYRLLSEAEWEYAARAGAATARPWGDALGVGEANCGGCGSAWDDQRTAPVGSFAANAFGLYDMLGNVWEWTSDCWNDGYADAPADGAAWTEGDCSTRVQRGGSWVSGPPSVRAAARSRSEIGYRGSMNGFRVARSLD